MAVSLAQPRAPTAYKPKFQRFNAGRTNTTEGLTDDYGEAPSPGVQDAINSGQIQLGDLGQLGYTGPAAGQGGGQVWDYGGQWGKGAGGFDYSSFIAGDWEVQEAQAMMAAQMARARGDYTADIRRAFIELGLPSTSALGSYAGDIDADTIKAAAANKYSMTAQIAEAATKSRAVNNATLAARGILSSGQTTKSQTDVTAGAEKSRYEALQGFLTGAIQGKRSIADTEFQLAQMVAAARSAAAARAAAAAQGWGGGGNGIPWSGVFGSNDYDYSNIPADYGQNVNIFGPGSTYGNALIGAGAKPPKPKKKPVPRWNYPGFIGGV